MRVHHLDCGTMKPRGQRLVNGYGSWRADATMVAHCLLVETGEGLVLVDTGYGLQDIAAPRRRLGWLFVRNVRPVLDPQQTAARRLEALGFARRDVRHIVLTHLDRDHVGGLADFPGALVHVLRAEHDAAVLSPTRFEQGRYCPAQWAHGPRWQLYDVDGERFKGLECVRPLVGTDVLLVPLVGHSRGHAAVAVNAGDRWLLHCGDAYFSQLEMARQPRSPKGMQFFQWLVAWNRAAGLANQQRLRQLKQEHGDEVTVLSSHDPDELATLARG